MASIRPSNAPELVEGCVAALAQSLEEALAALAPALTSELYAQADKARTPALAEALLGARQRLIERGIGFADGSGERVREGFVKRLGELKGEDVTVLIKRWIKRVGLALVPESELEDTLAANEIAKRVRSIAAEEYGAFLDRTAFLLNKTLTEESHPLASGVLGQAAIATLNTLSDARAARNAIHRYVAKALPAKLAQAIENCNTRLIEAGVLPHLKRRIKKDERAARDKTKSAKREALDTSKTVPIAIVSSDARKAPAPAIPPASEPSAAAPARRLRSSVEDAVAALKQITPPTPPAAPPPAAGEARNAATPGTSTPAAAEATTPPVASAPPTFSDAAVTQMERMALGVGQESELARTLGTEQLPSRFDRPQLPSGPVMETLSLHSAAMHALAADPELLRKEGWSTQRLFRELKSTALKRGVNAVDVVMIDVVGTMFDYVFSDKRLPDTVRPLLWRLQLPVLNVAILDKSFVAMKEHPARQLVESVAAVGVGFGALLTPGSTLLAKLEGVVGKVEEAERVFHSRIERLAQNVREEFTASTQRFERLLSELEAELKNWDKSERRSERRDSKRRPSKDREEYATAYVTKLIELKLERYRPSEPVRKFLSDYWMRHLRTAFLRDGGGSDAFELAQQTVDDLLWSLDERQAVTDRKRLIDTIPRLVRFLRDGIAAVGGKPMEFQPLFDEMLSMHTHNLHLAEQAAPPPAEPPAKRRPSVRESLRAARGEVPEPREVSIEEQASSLVRSLEVDDFPERHWRSQDRFEDIAPDLKRGDWLEFITPRKKRPVHMKVAWINGARTMLLLLERSNRKVVSISMDTLRANFDAGRAFLVVGTPQK